MKQLFIISFFSFILFGCENNQTENETDLVEEMNTTTQLEAVNTTTQFYIIIESDNGWDSIKVLYTNESGEITSVNLLENNSPELITAQVASDDYVYLTLLPVYNNTNYWGYKQQTSFDSGNLQPSLSEANVRFYFPTECPF